MSSAQATRPIYWNITHIGLMYALLVPALLVLMVVPGVLSTDLFSYIWYGRIFGVFGDNPFTHVPADYAWHDTGNWLQWVFWKETPSAYGPVWVLLAGIVAQIAQAFGGDIAIHLLGNKLLADVAHLANVLLIWKLAGLVITRYWPRIKSVSRGNRSRWLSPKPVTRLPTRQGWSR